MLIISIKGAQDNAPSTGLNELAQFVSSAQSRCGEAEAKLAERPGTWYQVPRYRVPSTRYQGVTPRYTYIKLR